MSYEWINALESCIEVYNLYLVAKIDLQFFSFTFSKALSRQNV